MNRILVTGANGFVGSALCRRLRSDGFEVVAGVRSPTSELQTKMPSLQGNVDWRPILEQCHAVIHAAGRAHVLNDFEKDSLSEFRKVNVDGTLCLAEQAAKMGVKRFIYISSIKVNGNSCRKSFTEADIPAPEDNYGLTKHEAEIGLKDLARRTGMEVVILRPTLIYGPNVLGNLYLLMRVIEKGYPLPFANVKNRKTFLGIDNFVDLISLCVLHPNAANQTYLVGDAEVTSVSDLIRDLGDAMHRPTRLFPFPQRIMIAATRILGMGDKISKLIGDLWIDGSKVNRELGWTPPLSQKQGLKQLMQKPK
jgi:nucleoside-diphosphate-sugar epimerase